MMAVHDDNFVEKIELNKDNSHKKADVKIVINGQKVGIQLTRFTLHELITRRVITEKRSLELVNLIQKDIEIDFNLNIGLSLVRNEEIPVNKKKIKEALAEEIAGLINENKDKLSASTDFNFFDLKGKNSRKLAKSVTLNQIEKEDFSTYHGKENIFIDYNYDGIMFSLNDFETRARDIYDRKNGGESEILIIWVELNEILLMIKELQEILIEVFKDSSFNYVFLYPYFKGKDYFETSVGFKKVKFENEVIKVKK